MVNVAESEIRLDIIRLVYDLNLPVEEIVARAAKLAAFVFNENTGVSDQASGD